MRGAGDGHDLACLRPERERQAYRRCRIEDDGHGDEVRRWLALPDLRREHAREHDRHAREHAIVVLPHEAQRDRSGRLARGRIRVGRGGREFDGKSIMGLLLLAASRGSEIIIAADGPDEDAAVAALCR
jgi:phosphotransferase system HPr (HPr) family protein